MSKARSGAREYMTQMAAAIWAGCAARPEVLAPLEKVKPKMPARQKDAPHVDFHLVPAHQFAMDGRLRNWGTWCNSRAAASSSPMFRLSASDQWGRRPGAGLSLDRSDAIVIARAVTALPEAHAAALNWYYVKPVNPRKAAETMGVSMDGLAALVLDARQMLINRGI